MLNKLTETEREQAAKLPVHIRATLQDIVGQIDRERDTLLELADQNDPLIAKLYSELTAVADRIHQAAYFKPRWSDLDNA